MGATCCSGISEGVNEFYELSTGQWDLENKNQNYSGKRQFIILNKSNLKDKNKIQIDMHVSENTKFIESRKYYNNQLPSNEDNFIDSTFKPEENSIISVDTNRECSKEITKEEIDSIKGLIWKKPNEIFRTYNYYLFKDISLEDIKQGMLGNCYFLSSISAIAELNERIKKIFPNQEVQKSGQYQVRLFIQGEPVIVIVDDYFPCTKNGKFAFTHSRGADNEIWVPLIEKAWAKVNSSYAMTIAGLPSEGLSTLTEGATVTYIHKKYSADELWRIIRESDSLDYIMCTCTKGSENLQSVGLVEGHAYTLVGVYDIDGLRLLKIRNPWGSFEWKGDYCDSSPLWTKELKDKVNYSNVDDGIFYMKLDDFLKYYPYTFICKYEKNFHYQYRRIQQTPDESMGVLKIIVKQEMKIMIDLHQSNARMFNEVPNYKNNMSRIILCKYHKDKVNNLEYISSESSMNEKEHIEIAKLEPGEYYVFVHVNWPYSNYKNEYVVSTYSQYPVTIEEVQKEEVPEDFLYKIFYSYLDKNEQSQKLNSDLFLQSSFKDNNLGFYVMLFRNYSKTDQFRVSFNSTTNRYVRLCTSHPESVVTDKSSDNKQITMNFNIDPDSDYIILYELENEPWLSKIQISSIKFTTKPGLNADPLKGVLRKHSNRMADYPLEIPEIKACEIETDDYMFLVFKNNLQDNVKMLVLFKNLTNIKEPKEKNSLYLEKNDIAYIKLEKQEKKKPVDFTYTYFVKKLLI